MSSKVILTVTRGEAKGKTYTYDGQERVLIGRQEDCAIVVPEKTVSRYHCLLEILPPRVRLQDFGSLNGTFLNGEKIGQRDREQSWEEARDQHHEAFDLKDGDVLGLGKGCEITCRVERKESCAICGADLPEIRADSMATVLTGGGLPGMYLNDAGQRICRKCHDRLEREEAEQNNPAQASPEREKPEIPAGQKRCAGCGKLFTPTAPDNNMCKSCLADRAKMLSGVLAMLNIHAGKIQSGDKPEKPAEQKPIPARKPEKPVQAPGPAQKEKALGPALLAGYEKISLLGKGGMGEVWKVREKRTGKEYALKTMLPDVAMDEHAKKLFLREASICECLRHPNVVKAYQAGCANNVMYILMDLCEGGSADDLIKKRGGKLPLELATYITLQVLSGLDYVHNMDVDVEIRAGRFRGTKEVSMKGIVHRDFKPGNIFLSDTGDHPTAMVADFGMAKAFGAAGKSQISRTGTVMGTPVFMPLQQARNCKYAKPEVDIWAAAASYYYMLTGQFVKNYRPGVNMWQVLVTEAAIPIQQRERSIPSAIARVIDDALTERPRLKYTSAAQLRKDLAAALPEGVRNYCRKIL